MNIKKIIKFAAIGGGAYALLNASFQYGKGYILSRMKKYDLTVDKAVDIVKRDAKNGPLCERINNKIIEVSASQEF